MQGLRSKIQTVQSGLSQNWISMKGNASSASKNSSSNELAAMESSGCFKENVDAFHGAELIAYWQTAWTNIHKTNEDNYEASRQLDRSIVNLHSQLEKERINISSLLDNLINLPVIQEEVHKLTAKIGSLCEDVDILEAGLFELDDVTEVMEFQQQMQQQKVALIHHRERRNKDLEIKKQLSATRHNEKIRDYELRLHSKLRDRQLAFEAEFERDMRGFREARGDPPVEGRTRGGSGSSATSMRDLFGQPEASDLPIECIPVEEEADQEKLEQFLQD